MFGVLLIGGLNGCRGQFNIVSLAAFLWNSLSCPFLIILQTSRAWLMYSSHLLPLLYIQRDLITLLCYEKQASEGEKKSKSLTKWSCKEVWSMKVRPGIALRGGRKARASRIVWGHPMKFYPNSTLNEEGKDAKQMARFLGKPIFLACCTSLV